MNIDEVIEKLTAMSRAHLAGIVEKELIFSTRQVGNKFNQHNYDVRQEFFKHRNTRQFKGEPERILYAYICTSEKYGLKPINDYIIEMVKPSA